MIKTYKLIKLSNVAFSKTYSTAVPIGKRADFLKILHCKNEKITVRMSKIQFEGEITIVSVSTKALSRAPFH